MLNTPSDRTWLTLISVLVRHTREQTCGQQLLNELCDRIEDDGQCLASEAMLAAQPEIRKAIEKIAPYLMLDFLMENAEIINMSAFKAWAIRQQVD